MASILTQYLSITRSIESLPTDTDVTESLSWLRYAHCAACTVDVAKFCLGPGVENLARAERKV